MFGRAPVLSGDWEDVPAGRLWKYVKAMPELEAERALDVISQIAAGTGSMEEKAHRQYIRELQRAASGGQIRAEKATAASLAAIGIQVETLPAAGEEKPARKRPAREAEDREDVTREGGDAT